MCVVFCAACIARCCMLNSWIMNCSRAAKKWNRMYELQCRMVCNVKLSDFRFQVFMLHGSRLVFTLHVLSTLNEHFIQMTLLCILHVAALQAYRRKLFKRAACRAQHTTHSARCTAHSTQRVQQHHSHHLSLTLLWSLKHRDKPQDVTLECLVPAWWHSFTAFCPLTVNLYFVALCATNLSS